MKNEKIMDNYIMFHRNNIPVEIHYTLIKGVNDSEKEAQELIRLLKGMLCHVNLIPVNNIGVEKIFYEKSNQKRLEKFMNILSKYGINATVRRTLGADINASCGQLRRKATDLEV